jgi:hypothetical protein
MKTNRTRFTLVYLMGTSIGREQLRRLLALVAALTLVIAACGGDDSEPATAGANAAIDVTTAPAATVGGDSHSLVIAAIDFDAGTILIRNDGAEPYNPTGHWLCNRPTYAPLPDETLESGLSIEIDTAALGIGPSDGEIGLFTSREFGSAEAIVRYVEWGNSGHGRSATAVEAGVWGEGDFVANEGTNLESSGSNPVSAADWASN